MNNKKKHIIIGGIIGGVIATIILSAVILMTNFYEISLPDKVSLPDELKNIDLPNYENKLDAEVLEISTESYPEISIVINKLSNKSSFSDKNINLYDNDIIIDNFKVEEINNTLTITYEIPERSKSEMLRNIKIENKSNSEDLIVSSYKKEEQKDINLNITQVDSNNFPEISVYFTAEDENQNIVEVLNESNITFSENEGQSLVTKKISEVKFIEKDQAISINMVIDTSGSMDTKISSVKTSAVNFLNNIDFDAGDKVEFIEFNDTSKINNYFTSNKQSLVNSVNSIRTNGQTALYDTLITALYETNLQDGAKCIIAFTDGLDNKSIKTSSEVINLSNQLGIPIYIIGLGEDIGIDSLKDISNKTDGEFININDIYELEKIYNDILRKTKKQYVLKYNLNEDTGNIIDRSIKLSIESNKYIGKINSEYKIKPVEYRVDIEEYRNLRVSLNDKIEERFRAVEGKYAIAFKDLSQSDTLSIGNEKTISASVIKIYVMIEAFNQIKSGKISLSNEITLKDSMKTEGSGIIYKEPDGTKYTVEELINLMMLKSDNTAANILIDMVGINNVNNTIKGLGCIDTELNRKMMDTDAIGNGIENYSSVDDLALTFTKLYNGQAIDSIYDKKMLDLMKQNESKSKIPNKLPSGVSVSNKSGEYNGVQNDAGIVFTDKGAYILSITTKDGYVENQVNAISDISKEIYDAYMEYKK